jgi:hypothetical protein
MTMRSSAEHVRRDAVSGKREQAGARDDGRLEGKRSQGNVDTNPGRGAQEQNPVFARELRGMVNPSRILLKQSLDKRLLATEARQHGQVHVDRFAWITPTLHRQSADEAESPAFRLTERLQIGSDANELNHVDRPS